MHITLETDYAIRIVDSLGRGEGRLNAQTIANKSSVTLRFSLKILSKLAAAGIVQSYKGSLGGYELARPLSDISLYDILEAIEGPFQLARCLNGSYKCTRNEGEDCPYHKHFGRISEEVRDRLKEIHMKELVRSWEPDEAIH